MPSLQEHLQRGDDFMRAGKPDDAFAEYSATWPLARQSLDEKALVWVLFSIANAALRAGDFEEALSALAGAYNGLNEKTGIVLGNPLFHLLVGLARAGLEPESDGSRDDFARALIGGGPEMFSGEDPRHLSNLFQVMEPPAETGTWVGYQGATRDLLSGATGYLREMIEQRLGK